MEKVTTSALIADIKKNLSQTNASHKDEVAVMQSMLSDPTYEVTVYGKSGPTGTYNPCKDFRGMCSSIIENTTKIPAAEAQAVMENYNVRKAEADSMVNISKEFIHTFLATGRKLPLGGRETSDVSLSPKKVPETTRSCPRRVGVSDDGSGQYSRIPTKIPAHDAVKVHAPCPSWIKNK